MLRQTLAPEKEKTRNLHFSCIGKECHFSVWTSSIQVVLAGRQSVKIIEVVKDALGIDR